MKKMTVAFIGCGSFARSFVPIMKNHPSVEKVYVCDLIRERAEDYAKEFNVEIIDSFEDVLADSSIDSIANFTQRHLHGDIVIRALKAGKNVYSAVPMASTVEECQEIVELVKEKNLIYMMGETCYYYPCAMFCREAFEAGKFGDFTYGAAQYYHHIDDISYGRRPNEGGMPPLLYPTHSTGMILSAVHSYVTKVVCLGYEDTTKDGRFGEGCNQWNNKYINQYTLMKLANGGTARVTEARNFGWKKPSSYISAIYGTEGAYECSNAQHILVEKDWEYGKEEKVKLTDVSDYINSKETVENKDDPLFLECVANGKWMHHTTSAVQQKEVDRLPPEIVDLPDGHMGTHRLLMDDFCKAVYNKKQPVLNAWTAARYTIPGLVAIKSCEAGGIPLDVPDCGECPEELM